MEDALLHDGSSNKRTQTKSTHNIFRREAFLGNTTKLRPAPNMVFFFKKKHVFYEFDVANWASDFFPVGRRGEKKSKHRRGLWCLPRVFVCSPFLLPSLPRRQDKTRQEEEGAPLLKQPRARLVLPPLLFFYSRRQRQVLKCCCCCCQNLGC